jgi:hypothetical protein
VIVVGLGWGVLTFGFGSIIDRVYDDIWPPPSLRSILPKILVSLLFGMTMWAMRQRRRTPPTTHL